jgi:integrase/recombinase XerD
MAKAILELGYSSALRPGEIRRLKIEDVDYRRRVLFIEQSKGKKDRTVPVGETALRWLRHYIREVRPNYLIDTSERCIFIGMRTGRAISDRAFTEFLSYRLKRAGFEHFAPHQLRASAATHMVEEGLDAGHLQRILGHQRLNTTKIYIQLQTDSLKKVLATEHPRVLAEKDSQKQGEKSYDF